MNATWSLAKEVGGDARLLALLTRFYDRLYDDVLIGFFFAPKDKATLVRSQFDYLTANLGDRLGTYEGPSIRRAHEHLAILPGHFDRRHVILQEVLTEFAVPEHVKDAWLAFDRSLRDFVLREGQKAIAARYP